MPRVELRNRAVCVAAGLCCIMVAGCGSVSAALSPSAKRVDSSRRLGRTTPAPSCPRSVRGQGMIAFAAREQVDLVDLSTCRTRVLAHANTGVVRFSADGRWVGYSPSGGSGPMVVSVRGGQARAPLGAGIVDWSWARTGELLYGLTRGGRLVSASPTGRRRVTAHLGRLNVDTGYPGLDVSPNGNQEVVDHSRCGSQAVGELDVIDLRTGARTVALRRPGKPVIFAGFSPNGRWLLFWPDALCSSSLAADGMPLKAVLASGGQPVTAVRHTLLFRDFLSWCGGRLIAAAGSSRETQIGSRLVQTGPPAWRQRTIDPARKLSWVSPSCAPSGHTLVAAAGPNNAPVSFGHQHRSIWLLRSNGVPVRRLTSPPAADLSDEAPRFSSDGRWILFVRSRVVTVGRSAISEDTIELVRTDGAGGAVPIANFTSNDFSYYDHFDWPEEIDWHQSPAHG